MADEEAASEAEQAPQMRVAAAEARRLVREVLEAHGVRADDEIGRAHV